MLKKFLIATVLFVYPFLAFSSAGQVPPQETPPPVEKKVIKKVIPKKPPAAKKKAVTKNVVTPKKAVVPKTEPPVLAEEQLSVQEKKLALKKMINEKKTTINNLEWKVERFPLAGGTEAEKDVVFFKDKKVAVKSLLDQGFSYTNYTLTIKDDETLVWETMQTESSDNIVFIKGEISPDVKTMRGIISNHKGGKSTDYSFKSQSRRTLSP